MKVNHIKWGLVSVTFLVTLSLIGCTSPTSTPTLTNTPSTSSTATLTTTSAVTTTLTTAATSPSSTTGTTNTTVIGTVLDVTGNLIAVQQGTGGTVVIATRRYSTTAVPSAAIVAIGIVRLGLRTSSTKVAIRLYPV